MIPRSPVFGRTTGREGDQRDWNGAQRRPSRPESEGRREEKGVWCVAPDKHPTVPADAPDHGDRI